MAYDAKQAKIWWPQPVAGEVVWCWTPWVSPPEPGPVQHPALVFRVTKHSDYPGFKVLIAPGTSKKTDLLHPGELLLGVTSDNATNAELQAEKLILTAAGLTKPTKFSLQSMAWIDYNDQFFSISWITGATTPLLGVLMFTENIRKRLASAKSAAGIG